MAEEAVISELVSARVFPVTWENTGEICYFRFLDSQGASAFGGKFSRLATEFPSRLSRENLGTIREPEAGNSEPLSQMTGLAVGANTTYARRFKSWTRNCLDLQLRLLTTVAIA